MRSSPLRVRSALPALLVAAGLLALLPSATARAAGGLPAPVPATPTVRTMEGVARVWRAAAPSTVVLGRSVQGRSVVATRQGRPDAPYVLLVLGQMHGSEPRGRDVVAALRRLVPPAALQVWTISTMNPDGAARGSRTNAHGVDLNRNFPGTWSPVYPSRAFWPGPGPASEPETRAVIAFLDRLRPGLVVSLHQHYDAVDLGTGPARLWSLRLASAMRLRAVTVPCSTGPCFGTLTQWFNHEHPGSAVTVELPLQVPSSLAAFYARAILRVGSMLVPASG